MRIDIELDDALLAQARALSGVDDVGVLVAHALRALVQREAARRLAAMGGSEPDARAPRRRRVGTD